MDALGINQGATCQCGETGTSGTAKKGGGNHGVVGVEQRRAGATGHKLLGEAC